MLPKTPRRTTKRAVRMIHERRASPKRDPKGALGALLAAVGFLP